SQAGSNPDQVCETCHEASTSNVAEDILMPNQDNCLACHAETKGAATLDCVSCHAFHPDGGTPSRLARDRALLQGRAP
ncbi:MAG: cytochrome c3 family protein, partial [Haliea sp.]|uniref:cytochrome c3 family protein n=1 Tax=Haliea sp. TaxID=1932666 RepID=UPI0032F028D8